MATIGRLQVELGLDSSGFTKGVNGAKESTRGFGDAMKSMAATAGGFLMANVIGNVAQAVMNLANSGLEFGKQMANVNSIAQLSDQQISQLSDAVLNLASDPRVTQGPAELAQGLYQIVSAGFSTSDSLTILKQAAMAASAGLTTSATATNAIVSVLDAYHLSADQAGAVSNSLFQTVNSGVVTFEQLANTIGTVLPTAASLGVSLNDLGAAYTVLTRQGVSADEATTQINQVLVGLLNPTTALTDALHSMGYESGAALLKAKGFGGAMTVLNTIIGGNADVATAMFGNVRALRGILGLTTNSGKDFNAALKEMNGAQKGAGATAKALDKQMQSASYQIGLAKKEMEIAATIAVGALSPAIKGLAQFLAFLTEYGLIPLINLFGALIAAVSPVTSAISDLAGVITTAWQGGKSFSDQISKLPAALQPLGLAVVEITHGIELLVRAWGKDGLQGVLDALPHSIDLVATGLLGLGGALAGFAGSVLTGLVDALSQVDWGGIAGTAWTALKDAAYAYFAYQRLQFTVAVDVVKWLVGSIPDVFDWLKTQVFGGDGGGDGTGMGAVGGLTLGAIAVTVPGYVAGKIADLWGWLTGHVFGSSPEGDGTSMQTTGGVTLPQVAVNVAAWAKGMIPDVFGWLKTNVGAGAIALASVTVNVAGWGAGKIADVGAWLASQVKNAAISLKSITVNIANWAAGNILDLKDWLSSEEQGVYADLKSISVNIANWAVGNIVDLGTFLYGLLSNTKVYLVTVGVSIAAWSVDLSQSDLGQAVANAISALSDVAGKIGDAVKAKFAGVDWTKFVTSDSFDFGSTMGSAVHAAIIGLPDLATKAGEAIGEQLKSINWTDAAYGLLGVGTAIVSGLTGFIVSAVAGPQAASDFKSFISDMASAIKGGIGPDTFSTVAQAIWDAIWNGLKALARNANPLDLIPGGGKSATTANGQNQSGFTPPPGSSGSVTDTSGSGHPLFGGLGGGGISDLLGPDIANFVNKGLTISATFKADDSDVAKKYTDVMTWGGIWAKSVFTGLFNGNDGDAAVKFTDSMSWGTIWGKSSFTGRFLGDDGNAAQKFTDVMSWGNIWGGSTFTARFAANNGPAAIAYSDAFGWGDTWANQTFTASFSIDTSGLYSALNTAWIISQEISDIMPHSPAKKGPLSRPITFDYIGDNFARMAGRVTAMAGGVSSAVAGAFGTSIPAYANGAGIGGNGGGGQPITITNNIYGADQKRAKQIADEVGAAIVREMSLR